jgi:hypothetical protein
MPNDPRTKFHEVLAVILKGVIKGLRTGLATCRFYIASIGSAPSISLYGFVKVSHKQLVNHMIHFSFELYPTHLLAKNELKY